MFGIVSGILKFIGEQFKFQKAHTNNPIISCPSVGDICKLIILLNMFTGLIEIMDSSCSKRLKVLMFMASFRINLQNVVEHRLLLTENESGLNGVCVMLLNL